MHPLVIQEEWLTKAPNLESVGELRQAACQTEGQQTAHVEARCLEFSDLHDAKALC